MSAPKDTSLSRRHPGWWVAIFLGVCVLLCGVGVALVMVRQKAAPGITPARVGSYSTVTVRLSGVPYVLQVADTPQKQELGLGQRDNLGPREGMLFSYADASVNRCFWMKDMRFSLDIMWLDSAQRIIMIEPSVSPATYPKTYCPPQPAQYVIEINAGRAHELNLQTGQQLKV